MRVKLTAILETDRDPIWKGKTLKELNTMLVDEMLKEPAIVLARVEEVL